MTTEVFANAWLALGSEAAVGTYLRRLDPGLDLYATITNPDALPGLLLKVGAVVEFEPNELRGSDKFEMVVQESPEGTQIHLRTKSSEASDIFLPVAEDIARLALARDTEEAAAITVVRRFNTWQRFLRQTTGGLLSEPRRLGLFGELATLRDLIIPSLGVGPGIDSWTGPDNAPQDFQTGRLAVEVKTIVHSEPQVLRIDGERQLDDFGLEILVLAHHRVFKHRGSGQTLPEIVAEIRSMIEKSPTALDRFDDQLLGYGYADHDAAIHYTGIGYTIKGTTHYRVREGFPRLTETDLRGGIGALEYSVAAAACEQFTVTADEILAWLAEPKATVEPSRDLESATIEYKETVWTPVGEVHNEEHRKSAIREIRTAVVKSVVAFMNSGGGELVLGVRDGDRSIVGVEVDLRARGFAEDDLDAYERELMALLMNHVDSLVYRQVRITFEAHEEGTACHVAVAPSPNPRFGHPPPKDNQPARPVFWVRAGNSTQVLEGPGMLDYITQQWT